MDSSCPSQKQALKALRAFDPEVKLLALGQTVFWDEPMKIGLRDIILDQGVSCHFTAGVHDTDYFAKLPGDHHRSRLAFRALEHNDTGTRDLWSAAAEFATLFGSETVITRDKLTQYGARLEKAREASPDILDSVTTAWGWKGVVATDPKPVIAGEVKMTGLFDTLFETLDWAIGQTIERVRSKDGDHLARATEISAIACEASAERTLGDYYASILGKINLAVAQSEPDEITRTSQLLRFNRETASLPRFELLDTFIRPETAAIARTAYDTTVDGTEMYKLARFGSFAVPFELVVPGMGRGTIRLANRGIVIMTPTPLFISIKKPVTNVYELAEVIEAKFGPECAVVGKALTLIGMLAREYSFVFHVGGSTYVKRSRALHQRLAESGINLAMRPILRVRYHTWQALGKTCCWLSVPEPLQEPFGTQELCSPSFGERYNAVRQEQMELLEKLTTLRSPLEMIRFLSAKGKGGWGVLGEKYESLRNELEEVRASVESLREQRKLIRAQWREVANHRNRLQQALGNHFRQWIFEKSPDATHLEERQRKIEELGQLDEQKRSLKAHHTQLLIDQENLVRSDRVRAAHQSRREIESEAELRRLQLIRGAIIATTGLENASNRPAAWWFPIVSPGGEWYREVLRTSEWYLEPLN